MTKFKFFSKKVNGPAGWDKKTYDLIVGNKDKGVLFLAITSMEVLAYAKGTDNKIVRNFFGQLVGAYRGSSLSRVRVQVIFDRTVTQKEELQIGSIYGGCGPQIPDEPDPQLYVTLYCSNELELQLEKLCIQAKTFETKYIPVWLTWSNIWYKKEGENQFTFEMAINKVNFQQNIVLSNRYISQEASLEEHVFSRPSWNQE